MRELYYLAKRLYGRFIFFIACLLVGLWVEGQPFYSNTASERGIQTTKTLQSIGNGISFRDFNNDGLDDLTFGTEAGQFIDFYLNEGGQFRKLDPLIDNQDEVKQLLWVDFDNDGDQDLYLATLNARNRLYERVGDLELIDITDQAGLSRKINESYGAVFGDFNRDGWLDLYYGEREWPVGNSQLYVNDGDGTFTKITINSGTHDDLKLPFCSAFFDYNNDNWPDLYTAQDKLRVNTMLRNDGNCSFTDVSEATESNLTMNAMCVAIGDYDNDGWQDVYVTNTPVGNAMLRNIPDEDRFEELAAEKGTGFYGNGWGSNFLDADNDGHLDLYVCGSIIGSDVVSNEFYRNLGDGTFEQSDYGFDGDTVASYVNAFGDFNQDGYPDIAVKNDAPFDAHFWENSGHTNHWLKVSLEGVESNRDGVGALIKVFTGDMIQSRSTHCGLGFLGQNTHDAMFGIGSQTQVDSIQVLWPTGHIDRLYELTSNQRIHVIEGSTTDGQIDMDPGISRSCRSLADPPEEIEEPEEPEVILSLEAPKALVYPNPVVDQLSLSPSLEDANVTIFDLSGKRHLEIQSAGKQIDLSVLTANLYLIIIEKDGQILHEQLLRKQ
ncbi:MAG: FG-GAP-like repeat-containing protein [Cytophagales bacterium]|nr:FG-GAP-like repeat-containing protein [Cytophagales bacterium]